MEVVVEVDVALVSIFHVEKKSWPWSGSISLAPPFKDVSKELLKLLWKRNLTGLHIALELKEFEAIIDISEFWRYMPLLLLTRIRLIGMVRAVVWIGLVVWIRLRSVSLMHRWSAKEVCKWTLLSPEHIGAEHGILHERISSKKIRKWICVRPKWILARGGKGLWLTVYIYMERELVVVLRLARLWLRLRFIHNFNKRLAADGAKIFSRFLIERCRSGKKSITRMTKETDHLQ